MLKEKIKKQEKRENKAGILKTESEKKEERKMELEKFAKKMAEIKKERQKEEHELRADTERKCESFRKKMEAAEIIADSLKTLPPAMQHLWHDSGRFAVSPECANVCTEDGSMSLDFITGEITFSYDEGAKCCDLKKQNSIAEGVLQYLDQNLGNVMEEFVSEYSSSPLYADPVWKKS